MFIFKSIHLNYILRLNRNCFQSNTFVRQVRKVNKDQLIWYPGHIMKGINQMNQNISKADVIIEIHDARIPFTGRTDLMNTFSQVKPRILVFNKIDLIPKEKIKSIKDMITTMDGNKERPIEIFFTQINDIDKQSKLLAKLNQTISQFITEHKTKSKIENFVLVGGLPNVGKSTFINGLRNWNSNNVRFIKKRSKRPTQVGINAGVTRSVSEKILLADGPPRIYILDSPGVWEPSKENIENVLKLALCGCLNFDSLFKEHVIDYMLYWLNQHDEHQYVDRYEMPGPTDDIIVFLEHICKKMGFIHKSRLDQKFYPSINSALDIAFRDFSAGKLGKFVLDDLHCMKPNEIRDYNARFAPLGSIFTSQRPQRKNFPFVWYKNKVDP